MAKAYCDTCYTERRDVQSVGKDSNGDPDAPDMCFICRKEWERNRVFDHEIGGYIPYSHAPPQ